METIPRRVMFHRLGLVTGEAALTALEQRGAIVFGLGGGGGWTAEALVRAGLGRITLVDNDSVCVTNINRQIQPYPPRWGFPRRRFL